MANIEKLETWEKNIFQIMTAEELSVPLIVQLLVFRNQNTPKSLFKYRFCNDLTFKNLKDNCLCSSNPSEFNDPFDSVIYVNNQINTDADIFSDYKKKKFINYFFKEYSGYVNNVHFLNFINSENFVKSLKNIENLNEIETEEYDFLLKQPIWNHFVKRYFPNLFIQCFSEVMDSILMWTHYADNHKGFCIEYEIINKTDIDSLLNGYYPVFYSKNLYDFSKVCHDSIFKKEVKNPVNFILSSLIKYEEWEYEKEWRHVEWVNISEDENLKKHKKLQMGKIKAIYLGIDISESNRKFLTKFAKENNIKIFKMYQSRTDISLKYHELFF